MIRLSGKLTSASASNIDSDRAYKNNFEWSAKLQAVHYFIVRNGFRPRFDSTDSFERKLARWLNTQIVAYNAGSLAATRLTEFIRLIPVDSLRKIRSFEERVEDLKVFVEKFGRLPKNTNDSERSLAQWLHTERVKYKRGLLSRRKEQLLESVKYALDMRTHSETEVMMRESLIWCSEHGHLPRASFSSGRELTDDERREAKLAQWLRNHSRDGVRDYESAESAFRREFIRELLAEYPTHSEFKSSTIQMEEADETLEQFGTTGSYSSRYPWLDANPEIKKLAELVLLEDFMSDWWGRNYYRARCPKMM